MTENGELALEVEELNTALELALKQRDDAVALAFRYGGIDEAHHKAWVIDQMIRILAGGDYERLVAEANNGDDGPNTYTWNEGIAP